MSQLNLSEMVMQTTGFNQEDMQLSLVRAELNVASSKQRFPPQCVNKTRHVNDQKLILRKLARVYLF